MSERPVYCSGCGSIVDASDRFCGVCGTQVSSNATAAVPTEEIRTIVDPPPTSTGGGVSRPSGRSRTGLIVAIVGGVSAILLILLVAGGIIAYNLLGTNTSETSGDAPSGNSDTPSATPAPVTTPTTDENTSPRDTAGTETEADESLSVGDTVDVEGVTATLNEVRTLPETDFDEPSNSSNVFLAADMTFENTTEEPVSISSVLEIVLKDGEGYSASQTIHTSQRQFSEGNIAPGERTSGEIVYDVPLDADDLQLDYTPFAGMETYTWEVGDADDLSGPAGSASGVEPDDVYASGTSPSAPDASGNTISYDAEYAVDGQLDTGWNVDGSGVGESITLEYDEPITVDEIGIVPGYDKVDPSDGTYRFFQLYVIERAEVEFSDGSTVELDFDRDPTMQYTEFPEVETDSIEITILETYPPGDSPYGEVYPYTLDKAAISEIEVLGP